jgi:hypothetical protein
MASRTLVRRRLNGSISTSHPSPFTRPRQVMLAPYGN